MKQWWFIILLIISFPLKADNIFVEAESFDCRGGWVLDNQSMGQMGSPYLLAHGLGVPVENASTVIRVENGGNVFFLQLHGCQDCIPLSRKEYPELKKCLEAHGIWFH